MAQPPPDDPTAPTDLFDVGDPFPTLYAVRRPAGAQPKVRTRIVRGVAVLDVAGLLNDVVEALDRAIVLALAEGPRGVACDLSGLVVGAEPEAAEMLADAGRHPRDWPAIPVAVACPDPQVRAALAAHPVGRHLIVTASMPYALSEVLRTPIPAVQRIRLMPHPTAPRAARDFVTRTLLDWHLGKVIHSASLVVSELVTNVTLHAHTEIDLCLAWNHDALRVTVRDRGPALPTVPDTAALQTRAHHSGFPALAGRLPLSSRQRSELDLHGRGLTIVAGLARAFGVLPTADGGKVVWAVLATPAALATPSGGSSAPLGADHSMISAPSLAKAAGREPTLEEDLV